MNNPAEQASILCLEKVMDVLKDGKSFLLEAGAGAGKTYTLIKALKYLIQENEQSFIKSNKRIACITYTNVAKDEIQSRTDNHPVVYAETIHAFCWGLIKDFQKVIRGCIPELSEKWKIRCDEVDDISRHQVIYNLGFPKITDSKIFLHHDDVIKLMTRLLCDAKFIFILKSKFPVVLIDEYQDTNKDLAQAMIANLVESDNGPLIGFFGDHWQKIYGSTSCGLITADPAKMKVIGKQANFRSDRLIVEALNNIRPQLTQYVCDPGSTGELTIYDSNLWSGSRRTENHWQEDLPAIEAHEYLESAKQKLMVLGWDFTPDVTKILMLTNNVLAAEQGYHSLLSVFASETDEVLKKNNPYISFLTEVVEPGCEAFKDGKYGQMFQAFKLKSPRITNMRDKEVWTNAMLELMHARENGTIQDVIEVLRKTKRPRLSEKVSELELKYANLNSKPEAELDEIEKKALTKLTELHAVKYSEISNVGQYIEDKTLFSTKHGVKGAEFDNVLVVLGRGWNHYNWTQMLEWFKNGVPDGKDETYERNRNLFYVACSRPKKRLALLFTQKLSDDAKEALQTIFQVPINSI